MSLIVLLYKAQFLSRYAATMTFTPNFCSCNVWIQSLSFSENYSKVYKFREIWLVQQLRSSVCSFLYPCEKNCKHRHMRPIISQCTVLIFTKFSDLVDMCGDEKSAISFDINQGTLLCDNQLINEHWWTTLIFCIGVPQRIGMSPSKTRVNSGDDAALWLVYLTFARGRHCYADRAAL